MDVSKETSAKFANMGFVCACLVVLIHLGVDGKPGGAAWWTHQMFTHVGMTRIAVPFFFFASGYWLAGHFCGSSSMFLGCSAKSGTEFRAVS